MDLDLNSLNVTIDYFIERKARPKWYIRETKINFHDLTYIIEGKSTYIVNDKPYNLEAGDLIYIPKGSLRRAFTSLEYPMHCFAFNFQAYIENRECFNLEFPVVQKIDFSEDLLNFYKKSYNQWIQKAPGYILKVRAFFMLILHNLIYSSNSLEIDKRIEKVKEYIMNNYQKKIELNVLAKIVNLSPVYLGAIFKKNIGYSIKQFINKIRIHKAENLLTLGEYNVSEVSLICGYDDLYYFSKMFKKILGINPSSLTKIKSDDIQ